MYPWPGNHKAAMQILVFFGIVYKSRNHQGMMIIEGEYAGKLLSFMLPQNENDGFGIQFRALDTHRNLGGALLHSCYGIEFHTEKKNALVKDGEGGRQLVDYKFVTITSGGGTVIVSRDGIEVDMV